MRITHRVSATAVVVVAAAVLAGCSGGGEPAPTDGSISGTVTGVFDVQYRGALEPIVENFEALYPDISVEIDYQGGSDLPALINTQIQGGTAPDILMSFPGGDVNTPGDNVLPLAAAGLIAPIEPDWAGDIPETWKSDFFYEDQLYAFPGAVQPLSAIYNQTFLDELGLTAPTTIEEVYAFCDAAVDAGVFAYAQGLGDTPAGPQMLSFGQTATLVYGPDPTWAEGLATGEVSYVGSGWETQFEIYQEMADRNCFGDGALGRTRVQGQEAVAQRQALGMVDVGAVLTPITEANPDDELVITAIPATDDGTNYVTALPIYALTVNAKAKNLAAAKAFVEFAGEPEQSALYATGFTMVPIIPNADFKAPPALADFAQLVSDNKTAKLAALVGEQQVTLNEGVQSMLLGNDTPETLAQKMQDAYESATQ